MSNSTTQIRNFKIVFVGPARSGKTAFIKRHLTGEFESEYTQTIGCEVYPVRIYTNHGTFDLHCWDTAGESKVEALRETCYKDANAVVAMYSLDTRSILNFVQKTQNTFPDIPIVFCRNKVDIPCDIPSKSPTTDPSMLISVKSNYNYMEPFMYLLKKLTGFKDLRYFVEPDSEEL